MGRAHRCGALSAMPLIRRGVEFIVKVHDPRRVVQVRECSSSQGSWIPARYESLRFVRAQKYTPFPPPLESSKIDREIESGD